MVVVMMVIISDFAKLNFNTFKIKSVPVKDLGCGNVRVVRARYRRKIIKLAESPFDAFWRIFGNAYLIQNYMITESDLISGILAMPQLFRDVERVNNANH